MSRKTMKTLLCVMLAEVLLVCGMTVCADTLPGGEVSSPAEADLDGDGVTETVSVMDILYEDGESVIGIEVKKGGRRVHAATEIRVQEKLYLSDVDGDGLPEILLTGDECSDDYITYCWRFRDGALVAVPFETGEVLDAGLMAVSPYGLKVFGTVNALGTYTGYRELVYVSGTLVFDGDAWSLSTAEYDYTPVLLTKQDVYAVATVSDEGDFGEEYLLPAGTTVYLTETDGQSWVSFTAETGVRGVFLLDEDEWGSHTYVNGMPEEEVFEGIEYAD